MRIKVQVDVSLQRRVVMEVEVEEGDEPTDLTGGERSDAIEEAQFGMSEDLGSEIVSVEVLP